MGQIVGSPLYMLFYIKKKPLYSLYSVANDFSVSFRQNIFQINRNHEKIRMLNLEVQNGRRDLGQMFQGRLDCKINEKV